MDEMNIASTKLKLVLTGIAVVGFSVVASLLATHVSFQISGKADYRTTMMVAFIIPMLVAPPSYGFVAYLSWKLKKANERLDKLAHLDPLTALHNRRSFVDAANIRLGKDSSQMLAMIDIDHFKKINDRIGHAGGDNALKHAAEVLRSSAPKEALLARLGGEEFGPLFALPQDAGGAAAKATEAHIEAMRLQLEAMPLITPQGLIYVTASFGLAISRPDETLDILLSRADMALYAAKNAGRNRLQLSV
jgi:diguanylate cyclase (GGDEF)-like protein